MNHSPPRPLSRESLAAFTGSETFYRHPLYRRAVYSEGVRHLADAGGAFWLVDEILLVQPYEPALRAAEFQVWTLTVAANQSATLVCTDGNDTRLYAKDIPWTDFPLSEISLWFANDTLYLPSEH